ncbi:MAG: hypothetical protein AAGD32_03555 [Planctomycetota bacterium]
MRKPTPLAAASAAALIGLTAPATYGAAVSLTASGTIDQLFNNTAGDLPSPLDGIAIGDEFTVQFTYFDDGAVDLDPDPNEAAYAGQIDPDSYVITIAGLTLDFVVETAIGVGNDGGTDPSPGNVTDTVSWGAQQSVDGTEAGAFSSGIALSDTDGTALSSTAIPLGPFTLADFEVAAFSINNIILDEFGVPTGESFSITGDIDFLEVAGDVDTGDGDDGEPGGGNGDDGNGGDGPDDGDGGNGSGDDGGDDLPNMGDDDGGMGGTGGGGNGSGGDGDDPAVIPVPAAAYSILPILSFLGYRKLRRRS